MNVKLQHVIRDVTGKTGLAIIDDIVSGERDAHKLAQHRDPRIRADQETIARSLQGHWREEHVFELAQALELYRVYQGKIAECDGKIQAALEQFELVAEGAPPTKAGRTQKQKNAPAFDVRAHLYRITGVDLTRIDGVDAYTALKVVSEIGTDMSKWPSAGHFASWLGLSPDNRITGGRILSSRTKRNANRAAAALRLAAGALHHSDSALGAFYRRKRAQLGSPKAITAAAHKLGQDHLLHVAPWTKLRGSRSGILRKSVSPEGIPGCPTACGSTGLRPDSRIQRTRPGRSDAFVCRSLTT